MRGPSDKAIEAATQAQADAAPAWIQDDPAIAEAFRVRWRQRSESALAAAYPIIIAEVVEHLRNVELSERNWFPATLGGVAAFIEREFGGER